MHDVHAVARETADKRCERLNILKGLNLAAQSRDDTQIDIWKG